MKSKTKNTVIAITVGLMLAGGGIAYMDHKLEKNHAEAMGELIEKNKREVEHNKAIDDIRNKYSGNSKARSVSDWTYNLQYMPDTEKRTAFSESIIAATADNVITDDEYKALSVERKDLITTNRMIVVRKIASEYAGDTTHKAVADQNK